MNGKKLALKARFNRGVRSIPDVSLFEINAVLAQQLAVFLLKRASAMVLLLRVDVEMAPLALSRHTAVSAVFWETPC
jgi:hypothetical protein